MPVSSSPNMQNLLASIFSANLINWLLHGVLTVQLYIYYLAFPNDRLWTKIAVYAVYVLETIQVIGIGVTLLLIMTRGIPFPSVLGYRQWASHEYEWATLGLLTAAMGSLVPLIAQSIYAHRIRIITQGKIIPCIIIALGVLQLCAAIPTVFMPGLTNGSVVILSVFWIGLNVVNDLIIAFIMVRNLAREKLLSNYTRSKVMRLMRLIIATGSLTVAANVVALILLFLDEYIIGGFSATAIVIFTPKLYANSILVLLNNRTTVKNLRDETPSNMSSTNVVSTLVAADRQIVPSDSVAHSDDVTSSTWTTR